MRKKENVTSCFWKNEKKNNLLPSRVGKYGSVISSAAELAKQLVITKKNRTVAVSRLWVAHGKWQAPLSSFFLSAAPSFFLSSFLIVYMANKKQKKTISTLKRWHSCNLKPTNHDKYSIRLHILKIKKLFQKDLFFVFSKHILWTNSKL